MRQPLLDQDPEIEPVDLPTLVEIARAVENESVERYEMLAQIMERRGEQSCAAAFRVMLEEERRHVESVKKWASSLGEQSSLPPRFDWQLPSDSSTSWEEVAGSTLLTPYRAFAIAVENETRAFAFYTFLAARAEDAKVQAQAERLAAEELRHAALMRRWRRQAWHRERGKRKATPRVHDVLALHAMLVECEAEIASCHGEVAARLRAIGDEESALLLDELRKHRSVPRADLERLHVGAGGAVEASADSELAEESTRGDESEDAVHLLVRAQRPVEGLGDSLEAVMSASEGPLFNEADRAMASVVTRLARISLQIGERMEADSPAL